MHRRVKWLNVSRRRSGRRETKSILGEKRNSNLLASNKRRIICVVTESKTRKSETVGKGKSHFEKKYASHNFDEEHN